MKTPRKNVGSVSFTCPKCGRSHSRTLWAEATEFYADTGKPTSEGYGFVRTEVVVCPCGAQLIAADDCENVNIYWINRPKEGG